MYDCPPPPPPPAPLVGPHTYMHAPAPSLCLFTSLSMDALWMGCPGCWLHYRDQQHDSAGHTSQLAHCLLLQIWRIEMDLQCMIVVAQMMNDMLSLSETRTVTSGWGMMSDTCPGLRSPRFHMSCMAAQAQSGSQTSLSKAQLTRLRACHCMNPSSLCVCIPESSALMPPFGLLSFCPDQPRCLLSLST